MARPLTPDDVVAGRIYYLDCIDRFLGNWTFKGPYTDHEVDAEATALRMSGWSVNVITAPTGYGLKQ